MNTTTETTTLSVPDISCSHCIATVTEAVGALEGVEHVDACDTTKRVVVTFNPNRVTVTQIRAALAEADYPAEP